MTERDESAKLPEKLREKPWASHKADLPHTPPTMLAAEELQLLHLLATRHFTGEGAIVDAGCLLGGGNRRIFGGFAY